MVDKKKCITCGACVSICPVGAIKIIDGKAHAAAIKKEITELVKTLIDRPIKMSFVIENFENPLIKITKNAIMIEPKKPKKE